MKPHLSSFSYLFMLLISFSGDGCGDNLVSIPLSDDTPPTVEMHILGMKDVVLTKHSDDVSRDVDSEALTLLAIATDRNGGVKRVKIVVSISVHCDAGDDIGASHESGDFAEESVDGGPGEPAFKELETSLTVPIKTMRGCPQGTSLSLVRGWARASAENYHEGMDQTAFFYFSYKP